jgi:hypothetical protein
MDALTEIDRLRGQHDLQVSLERDHLSPRTAASTMANVA